MKKIIDFLNLGDQPLANYYLKKEQIKNKEKKYKLIVCYDTVTRLVSIKKTFSSKMMFNDQYPYRSSMSKTMQNHLRSCQIKLNNNLNRKKFLR